MYIISLYLLSDRTDFTLYNKLSILHEFSRWSELCGFL